MGPNTRTTDWSLADDDFDIAMGPATTHEIENGVGDVQLDDAGRAAEMATGKAFEETRGAKMESTRERQVKVLRSYPLVFAVCSCPAAPVVFCLRAPFLPMFYTGQLARSLCRALGATLVTGIWTSICSTFRDPGTRRLGSLSACLSRPYSASCSFRCIGPRFLLVVASLLMSGPGIELCAT